MVVAARERGRGGERDGVVQRDTYPSATVCRPLPYLRFSLSRVLLFRLLLFALLYFSLSPLYC